MVLACVNNAQSQHSGLEPHRKGHLKDYPLLVVEVACHNLLQVKLEFDNEVGEFQYACPSKKAEHFTVEEWTDTPEPPCIQFAWSKMKVIMTFLKICLEKSRSGGNENEKRGLSKIIESLKEQWTEKDEKSVKHGSNLLVNAHTINARTTNTRTRSELKQAQAKFKEVFSSHLKSNIDLEESIDEQYQQLETFEEKFRTVLSAIKIEDGNIVKLQDIEEKPETIKVMKRLELEASKEQGSKKQGSGNEDEKCIVQKKIKLLESESHISFAARKAMYAFADKPLLSELKPKVLEVFPKSAFPENLNVTVDIKKIVVPPKSENTPL